MMKRLTLILSFLMLVFIPLASHAQDAVPWPPDPKTIFADGVEGVLASSYDAQIDTSVPTEAAASSQNETRVFTILYEGAVKSISYPDEFVSAQTLQPGDDGVWRVSVEERIPDSDKTQWWVWSLDPATGTLSRYVAHCGEQPPLVVSDVQEENWRIYVDPQTNAAYVCETATGELSQQLPSDMFWIAYDHVMGFPLPIYESPDGAWLVIFAVSSDHQDNNVYIYSYAPKSGSLTQLGSFEPYDNFGVDHWVGTQVLISTSEMPEWSTRYIYIADAAKPDSLEMAVERNRYEPEYKDDPPRYDFVSGIEGGDGPPHCSWVIYTIETRQLASYDMGSLCLPEIGKLGETAYYRDVPDFQNGLATLVRFNPITQERKDLYAGEIESVEWVSPTEHYAVLTLDDNGIIDTPPSMPVYLWGTPGLDGSPQLSLVDLNKDEIAFQIPTGWYGDVDFSAYPLSSITLLSGGRFLAISVPDYGSSYASIFQQKEGQWIETHLVDNAVMVTPDKRGILFWSDEPDTSQTLKLYDIASGVVTPITQSIDTSQYRVQVSPSSTVGLISLVLYSLTDGADVAYDFHLPDSGTNNVPLSIGAQVVVKPPEGQNVRLREQPGTDAPMIVNMTDGVIVSIIDGPDYADGFTWWKVRLEDGREGWTVDTAAETQTLVPLAELTPAEACSTTPAARLTVGQDGRVAASRLGTLRQDPALSSSSIRQVPGRGQFSVLYGPVCNFDYYWWQVDYNGERGWLAEGNQDGYWLNPVDDASESDTQCPGALEQRLQIGEQAEQILSTDPVNVLGEPLGKTTLFLLFPGTVVDVLDGPLCIPGGNDTSTSWWQVRDQAGHTGWVAEGKAQNYFFAPYIPPTITPTPLSTDAPLSASPTLTQTSSVPADAACVLTTLFGVKLRGGPGAEFDPVGSAAAQQSLAADGQTNGSDGFIWWRLVTGEWVREDLVSETDGCKALPVVNLSN